MKLSIKTMLLQEMLGKAIKGCSNNKILPLTSLLAIELKDNRFVLTTSDATNYLCVATDKIIGEDFYVVVQADQFSKLVAKTTSETIELEVVDGVLNVKGNGKYVIELPLDEEGQLIKFPNPLDTADCNAEKQVIQLSTIKTILGTARSALATDVAKFSFYTGYYSGDNIIATDTYKICGIKVKLFDTPVLISPEFMNLLDVMTDENLDAQIDGDTIIISDGHCTVYGKTLPGIEDYQVDAINGLLSQDFTSMCELPKDVLLSVLDRLALFVGTYDKNGIHLTFTKEGIMISSMKSSGTETIPYIESENFNDFTCCIDIDMLQSQIKSQTSATVEMWYGQDNAIKMVDGNTTQIIALTEE